MAVLKACVRRQRSDGFWQVYIRVTQQRKVRYIKTDKVVSPNGLSKAKEIKDAFVQKFCAERILFFNSILNTVDTTTWSVNKVIEYLQKDNADICFSDYARQHINKQINTGHERTSKNYKLALEHLERYFGTTKVMFSQLTSNNVNKWVESLASTHRAKEMYPTCMRQVFRAAVAELNDYDNNIIRIKNNPWMKVSIPESDRTTKRAISPEDCRRFFSAPMPETKMLSPLSEFGRDVAKIILCLGGINTVDLYSLQKTDYHNGVIGYKRAKTKHSRKDEAYFEMRVEPIIKPLMEKYKADDDDPYLFNFHTRFHDSDSFNANVNNGIKKVCKSMGLPKEQWYCVYTFRHTWGTVAQNDCDATISEVAFGMNHIHGFSTTRGYIKVDFTPAWELNAKVIDFIFFSTKKSKQGKAQDLDNPDDKAFRLSAKKLVYARAYFKGEVIAEKTDIGFHNIEEVIASLVPKFPDTIPPRSAVTFRIKDIDGDKELICERTKGKGF